MPSGNWADMMDFWHCHKPETESKDGDAVESKYANLQRGYTAVGGTALVELTYFLIAEGDCGSAVEVVEVIESSLFSHSMKVFSLSVRVWGKKKGSSCRKVSMAICADTIARDQLPWSVS